ncbi:MAG: SelT/SelW/SelH family protein [Gemmatimonadota bacterium]
MAVSLADALKARYDDVEVEFLESSGGVFEVTVDGRLVYSKRATGRHATHEEVFEAIDG